MEVIVGDFGMVVVPRDGADTERIMNHSSILRKYKVSANHHILYVGEIFLTAKSERCDLVLISGQHRGGERCEEPSDVHRQLNQEQVGI